MANKNCCICCPCCQTCCNIIWVILIGWELFLFWCIFGIIYCISLAGIPCGKQCFKIACFVIWPFGKDIVKKSDDKGCCGLFGNIIWIIFGGGEIALIEIIFCGISFCTIIGIPFGIQLWKLVKITFSPYGNEVVKLEEGDSEKTKEKEKEEKEKKEDVQIYESEREKPNE